MWINSSNLIYGYYQLFHIINYLTKKRTRETEEEDRHYIL